jgi:hypothetical protein
MQPKASEGPSEGQNDTLARENCTGRLSMLNRVARWVQATSSGGILGAATMKFATMCNRFVWLNSILLFTKFSRYPLICRLRTSDRAAFRQIFIWRDYAALDQTQNVGLLISH